MANEQAPPVKEFRFDKNDPRRIVTPNSRELARYELYVRYCKSVDITPMDYDTWFIRIANTAYTMGFAK